MGAFNTLRYIVAAYGLVLQANYPFDSLPITDSVKESLKRQVPIIVQSSAIFSLSVLCMLLWTTTLLCTIRLTILLAMRFRPAFREKMQKRAANKAKKALEAQKKKKRVSWLSIVINLILSTAMIVNDAIYNRPEDAASFQEGVLARAQYLLAFSKTLVILQMEIVGVCVVFTVIFAAIRRRFRTRRAAADEESRLAPSETVQAEMVQAQPGSVLDEKLIDISDGVDGVYEKVEAYVSRDKANSTEYKEEGKEVLIEL
ncbi:hypothetical protein BDP27DRAFT_583544 [Rhodocollybia butyracea]|uniref:Uncharacterized protein n=1 Tax=Rhodocollybia butyracea TaxID=206335 RepID=A0A9P5PR73_9AGAR|nr:hypothetical protein BDP27DRAFT_583544 [Rhodocollybia butyracea]